MDVSYLLSHVRNTLKHDGSVQLELKKRLLDPKKMSLNEKDFYTLEWFSKFYDSDKTLTMHKMIVPRWKIAKHIERTFSPAMTEKILNSLEIIGNQEVHYKTFLSKVGSKLISAKREHILRFCFDMLDYNDNK